MSLWKIQCVQTKTNSSSTEEWLSPSTTPHYGTKRRTKKHMVEPDILLLIPGWSQDIGKGGEDNRCVQCVVLS